MERVERVERRERREAWGWRVEGVNGERGGGWSMCTTVYGT